MSWTPEQRRRYAPAISEAVRATATVRLATVTYSPSVILTGVKSLSYAANMQATRIAEGRGADEAVLVRPDKHICWRSDELVAEPEAALRQVRF